MLNLNGQGHLQGAVESLRRNTPGRWAVVVDNGGTDASLDSWAQDDLVLVGWGRTSAHPRGGPRAWWQGGTILFCDNDVVCAGLAPCSPTWMPGPTWALWAPWATSSSDPSSPRARPWG